MKKPNNIAIFAAGIVLFILSLPLDRGAFYFFKSAENPFFDAIFGFITNFLNIFVILILATTLFLLNEKKRKMVFPLWISFFLSIATAFILKLIIERPRPLGESLYAMFDILSYSFPSMHAMAAFALLPVLNKEFPKLRILWLLSASIFAFSRLYFNYHFLSDVIFGAFLGYFVGIFAIYFEKKCSPFRFLK